MDQLQAVALPEALPPFSLDDLDQARVCDTPFEFEVTDDATGKGIGIFLSVIGGQAKRITDLTTKTLNERRIAEAMAQKTDPRNKRPHEHVVPIEDDLEFTTELVAIRVVGWRGRIKEPYSHANAVKLCKTNQPIRDQILEKSENLKNFPIGAPKN